VVQLQALVDTTHAAAAAPPAKPLAARRPKAGPADILRPWP